ncbi:MAG: DinB family protein [candidate division KSB1 bacterium]|nr:DinB family protein [candidate division KSB1 bacterium]MDZ7367332.1 DinB family protein [candidate division KSB1 bacterium]MDZ7405213.1 DinB family protein [candidate division KSB1 bacterium]
MSNFTISRPEPTEYAPYYGKYIELVPAGDLIDALIQQMNDMLALLRGLSEAQAETRYEPGKWSIKEVLGHLIDTERVMSYRALRIARADETPLPGFEQDDYVRAANFDARSLPNLLEEYLGVRGATVALFRNFDAATIARGGTANNVPVTVRALAYIIAGHERHHVQVLRTKYLPLLTPIA